MLIYFINVLLIVMAAREVGGRRTRREEGDGATENGCNVIDAHIAAADEEEIPPEIRSKRVMCGCDHRHSPRPFSVDSQCFRILTCPRVLYTHL